MRQELHIIQNTGQDARMVRIGAGCLFALVEADLTPSDHADPH